MAKKPRRPRQAHQTRDPKRARQAVTLQDPKRPRQAVAQRDPKRPREITTLPAKRKVVPVNPFAAPPKTTVTRSAYVTILAFGTTMVVLAGIFQFFPVLGIQNYAVFALIQGGFAWGGYVLRQVSRKEAIFPKKEQFAPFKVGETFLLAALGLFLTWVITYLANKFLYYSVGTFLLGAYEVMAGACETMAIVALIEVGGIIGRQVHSKVGEKVGQVILIPLAAWALLLLHFNYAAIPAAQWATFGFFCLLGVLYVITLNLDAVFWIHMFWNLFNIVKSGV